MLDDVLTLAPQMLVDMVGSVSQLPEECLEVVWELCAARIPGVHGDCKVAAVVIHTRQCATCMP